jgi:hypothetical protein
MHIYIYIYLYIFDSLSFDGFETRPYVGRPTSNRRERGKEKEEGKCLVYSQREKKIYASVSI